MLTINPAIQYEFIRKATSYKIYIFLQYQLKKAITYIVVKLTSKLHINNPVMQYLNTSIIR